MIDSQATTLSSTSRTASSGTNSPSRLNDVNLSGYPPIYLIKIQEDTPAAEIELHLRAKDATLVSYVGDAQIVLTDIERQRRAKFELQSRKVKIEPLENPADDQTGQNLLSPTSSLKRKRIQADLGHHQRRRVRRASVDSSTASEPDANESDNDSIATAATSNAGVSPSKRELALDLGRFRDRRLVKVVKLAWFYDSLSRRRIQLLDNYTILEGALSVLTEKSISQSSKVPLTISSSTVGESSKPARDQPRTPERNTNSINVTPIARSSPTSPSPRYSTKNLSFRKGKQKPPLLRETTSEHEAESRIDTPDWVKEKKYLSCERVTLQHCPNEGFVEQLRIIRHGRELRSDEIGVRAYSSMIASIAAYPRVFRSAKELADLPGCDEKAVGMFRQFQAEGQLVEAHEIQQDKDLRVKDLFWNIHGVGPKTADEFFNYGWKDLDDIIEYGWNKLTNEQKIGVKFCDEFREKIPRPESERIASIIAEHARELIGDEVQYMIVGGYRRGKPQSGDVDIVLSHPEEDKTLNLIENLVAALAESGWVTHELEMHTTNSKREQKPIPANIRNKTAFGFDSLDKALLVWQDPSWPSKEQDLAANPNARNPAIHRRVDIIISPWKTVGCAVMGWSSGTTFQRDVRRFAKLKKKWKFDSSGVRDRLSGNWLDLERWSDPSQRATTIEEAEKRVFEGLGLEWKEPRERCTD